MLALVYNECSNSLKIILYSKLKVLIINTVKYGTLFTRSLETSVSTKNPVQHSQTGFKFILVNDYSFTTPISQNFSILCSIILSVFNLPKAAKSFTIYSFNVLPINSGS